MGVRTKTLVKNAIVQIDGSPFKQWFEAHYGVALGRKKGHKVPEGEEDPLTKPRSKHLQRTIDARKPGSKVEQHLEEQFTSGRVYAPSHHVRDNLVDVTDTSSREKNLTSTL